MIVAPKNVRTGIFKSCITCDKSFYVKNYRKNIARFCSSKCRGESGRKRFSKNCGICGNNFEFIATREDRAKYCSNPCRYQAHKHKGKTQYECFYCYKTFMAPLSTKRKYCSKACVNKKDKETWRGKFTTIRKNMVRRNMLNKCQICGFDSCKKILGIHHIDHNRNNNELSNLIVLCPNCHSLEHQKHITHVG